MRIADSTGNPPHHHLFSLSNDTSYSIDSEDDEFYANVDLGDGDLGRPIDFEEGMGGVSVSDVTFDPGAAATSENPRQSPKAPQGNSVHGQESSSSGRGEATALGGFRFSHSNAPQFQAGPSTANTVRQGVGDAVGAPTAPPKTRESNSGTSASSSEARRGTPSMGGFHFPPGMNPAIQQPKPMGPPRSPNRTTGSTSSSSNISGLKRKADTMQASSSSSRPLQGLGLAQQQQSVAGNPNGTRRPLANLDFTVGGDMKRPKH
ncbi:hypothetical protein BDR07DRAFT_915111 [Suillus spraguei]|nr:hypothetical protein BDR07DRAFT_915111 [Suillus spraguei]